LPPSGGGRRDQASAGKCPRRTKGVLPGRPQGSGNLPWDVARIAAKRVRPPGAGGWDGVFAYARDVGGGIGPANGTSGIVKIPSAWSWCVAGRRRSGNGNVGRHLRGVRSTRRRNVSDASVARAGASCRLVKIPKTPLRRRARGHAAKLLFRTYCATGPGVMSLRVIPPDRHQPIAATHAAGRCVG